MNEFEEKANGQVNEAVKKLARERQISESRVGEILAGHAGVKEAEAAHVDLVKALTEDAKRFRDK